MLEAFDSFLALLQVFVFFAKSEATDWRALANLCYSPVHSWTCVCNFDCKQFIASILPQLSFHSPVVSWCCGRMQSPNDVIQKIEKSLKHWYSYHNTATMVFATPRHFLFWARLLEFRSFTFSLAYSFDHYKSFSGIIYSLLWSEPPAGYPNTNSNKRKIESARRTMGRGKRQGNRSKNMNRKRCVQKNRNPIRLRIVPFYAIIFTL